MPQEPKRLLTRASEANSKRRLNSFQHGIRSSPLRLDRQAVSGFARRRALRAAPAPSNCNTQPQHATTRNTQPRTPHPQVRSSTRLYSPIHANYLPPARLSRLAPGTKMERERDGVRLRLKALHTLRPHVLLIYLFVWPTYNNHDMTVSPYSTVLRSILMRHWTC